MADVNIIISREEYTELLTLKIKRELEAQHKAELEELEAKLDEALENSDYWYKEYHKVNSERRQLKAELEKLSCTSKGAE